MPRPKAQTTKVSVTLPKGALGLLDKLVMRKLYGESRSEIARHIIVAGLDTLVEKGRLDEA